MTAPPADLTERARQLRDDVLYIVKDGVSINALNQLFDRLCGALQSEREAATAARSSAPLSEFRNRVSVRLNNHLVEMKPGYDDSITGFNEAWDILMHAFDESLERLASPPAPQEARDE